MKLFLARSRLNYFTTQYIAASDKAEAAEVAKEAIGLATVSEVKVAGYRIILESERDNLFCVPRADRL
jgi:hypothetical protein